MVARVSPSHQHWQVLTSGDFQWRSEKKPTEVESRRLRPVFSISVMLKPFLSLRAERSTTREFLSCATKIRIRIGVSRRLPRPCWRTSPGPVSPGEKVLIGEVSIVPTFKARRLSFYRSVWEQLRNTGLIYPSPHSRKDVERALLAPHDVGGEKISQASLRPP